ncbi:unnamed protein product [Ambrosiozyma monospora]|uniref:Unnamed protein product n=1 Tax=Ambrosiozyma monospora TaxID=43982 RepID=A0ACB5TSJ1_AMBMO|nr:unnamed protein product [Ambrosiozyma monospora]
MASQLRVPGGFRRDFIIQKHTKFGYDINPPNILTRNFLEFLSIYGHFAGEDLEDEDFLACDIDDYKTSDEESGLLSSAASISSGDQLPRPHIKHKDKPKGTASTIKAFFLLLKGFVGTGVLFLPKAFYNGGLLMSIGLLLGFAILSYWCYLILVQTKVKIGVSSFGDIGLTIYGKPMKVLILMSIVLSQIGFVAAYIVFTAENIHAFLINVLHVKISIATIVCAEALILMPMSLIRNITKLSLAALLANIFILSGILTIVYFASEDLISWGVSPSIQYFNEDNWSLFIGVAIFAFEGIGLIIPVQESMKYPEQYPKVLLAVILVCSALFIGVGTLGYTTYGDDVQTVVILNLPQDSIAVNSIQFFYALAIMLSVPLQLLPAVRIMETRLFKRRESEIRSNY